VLSPGHFCTFDDGNAQTDTGPGMQRTINNLLVDGYSVFAVYMPHATPADCGGTAAHDQMFDQHLATSGSELKFFLEPIAAGLNYLKTRSAQDQFPQYTTFDMVGLSGGGWTTVLYAAIDPTIRTSVHVAGSMPLFLTNSIGDREQTLTSFYTAHHYLDLYIMGAYGAGRRQVQVLNRRDSCCFGEAQHPAGLPLGWEASVLAYERSVRDKMFALGSGSFHLEIDEAAPSHMISWNTLVDVILTELNGGRAFVGAGSTTDAFVRGLNGNLWHNGAAGWLDTGFPMIGTASATQAVVNQQDVFFRSPSNQIMHAFTNGSGWQQEAMGGTIITDPVAVASNGENHVLALGMSYSPFRWNRVNGVWQHQAIDASFRGLGRAAAVSPAANRLEVFLRGFDRAVYRLSFNGTTWSRETAGGTIVDFPSAIADSGNLRVYARGLSPALFEAFKSSSGSWQWTNLTALTSSISSGSVGTPAVTRNAGNVRVYSRTSSGSLASFTLQSAWTFTDHGGSFTGSPAAANGGALVRGQSGSLWFFDGANWLGRGGAFD
jgi:hypothetical protein